MGVHKLDYQAPWGLRSGLAMTLYTAWGAPRHWQKTLGDPEPPWQERWCEGFQGLPLFTRMALPPQAKGTIIATYGITGSLAGDQWQLAILGRKAYAQGLGLVFFDWRAHGKTGERSPELTSDGIYEGHDYLCLMRQALALGFPPPYWFVGYSLGGQLALWGVRYGQEDRQLRDHLGGGAVICPSVESNRSLVYLENHPTGRYLERAISQELRRLALELHRHHPEAVPLHQVDQAHSIRTFDQHLVIDRLGFATVADYYHATSPLYFLPGLTKPTLMLYAADDPLFAPALVGELQTLAAEHPHLDLYLTDQGGHVGYRASRACQTQWGDTDCWWAWQRLLDWCEKTAIREPAIASADPLL